MKKKRFKNQKKENEDHQNEIISNQYKIGTNFKFEDIVGHEEVINHLKEIVILPMRYPHLFVGLRKPFRAVLLYGVKLFYYFLFFYFILFLFYFLFFIFTIISLLQ